MSRSLRNELLVAIGAVVLLGLAILFGVLISENAPDENGTPEVTATDFDGTDSNILVPSGTAIAENVADAEGTLTAVATSVNETLTAVGAEITLTLPSITRVTPQTNTATTRPTRSSQVSGLATDGPDATETASQQPTELDETEEVVITSTLRPTRVRPTATEEASATFTPTATDTPTPTETPEPTATPTRTPTATVTPTITRTVRPSEISPLLPTLTPLSTEVGLLPTLTANASNNASSVNEAGCFLPDGWQLYVVQHGNTVFSIARAVGSSVGELSRVNCLADVNRITTGDVLFVPRVPALPVSTASAGVTPVTGGLSPVGCNNPAVQISSPGIGQQVSGTFNVVGNASYGERFGYYSLQIRADSAVIYNFYSRSENPVLNGVLGQIDSGLFSPGLYWLRVLVVDNTGNVPADATCVIPIIID